MKKEKCSREKNAAPDRSNSENQPYEIAPTVIILNGFQVALIGWVGKHVVVIVIHKTALVHSSNIFEGMYASRVYVYRRWGGECDPHLQVMLSAGPLIDDGIVLAADRISVAVVSWVKM